MNTMMTTDTNEPTNTDRVKVLSSTGWYACEPCGGCPAFTQDDTGYTMTRAEADELIASITPNLHGLGTLRCIPAVPAIDAMPLRRRVRKAG